MNSRDLKADLELCNKATPGPWYWSDGDPIVVGTGGKRPTIWIKSRPEPKADDITFFCAAREGWPHAIERALEAEALVNELRSDSKTDDAVIEGPAKRIEELESLVRELAGVIDDLRRQINECGLDNEMWEVYERAKEVLGDE